MSKEKWSNLLEFLGALSPIINQNFQCFVFQFYPLNMIIYTFITNNNNTPTYPQNNIPISYLTTKVIIYLPTYKKKYAYLPTKIMIYVPTIKNYNTYVQSTISTDSRSRFEGRGGIRTPPRLPHGAPRKVTCSSELLIFLWEFHDFHVP